MGSNIKHSSHRNETSYGMTESSSSTSISANFISSREIGGAYDFGELDQALFLYLDEQAPASTSTLEHHKRFDIAESSGDGTKRSTLNIFPSQPMHVGPPNSSPKVSKGLVCPESSSSKSASSEPSIALTNSGNHVTVSGPKPEPSKSGGNRRGNLDQEGPKTPDPKTLRRLAQNREAARKSRLRKKAYVQQLESSRMKLTQLEQEIQRSKAQGIMYGGSCFPGEAFQWLPPGTTNISTEAAVFEVEYARWSEEHHRIMCELRAAVQESVPENELRLFVESGVGHYEQLMNLKAMVAKGDAFHIVSGSWMTPAERCFIWIGGFKPSQLLKIVVGQIEELREGQIVGIYGLQKSTEEAEEALSHGLEALNKSVSDSITSDSLTTPPNIPNYMTHMAIAISKLSTLQAFLTQADNLRHQSIERLHEMLTTRQAATSLLAMAEYFHRLRTLSSVWLSRPPQP